MTATHTQQIERGERFAFGKNWQGYLKVFTEERLEEARTSLRDMLQVDNLKGKRFLDAGCGSGLFSLAAYTLGAEVHSFDFDPDSVECAKQLRSRQLENVVQWQVEDGSVLDEAYLESLGTFDVVYSWGVLHHTGAMWRALELVQRRVRASGKFFVSIYNDQGRASKAWRKVKEVYCSGLPGKSLVSMAFIPYFPAQSVAAGVVKHGGNPLGHYLNYKRKRGMSAVHDWIDWLGGYPFEVAKPEEIIDHCTQHGFRLSHLRTTNRLGCNEFVFFREPAAAQA